MYKLHSLRTHLLTNVAGLSAEALHTFIDSGHIESTASASMSFVYHYQMQVIATDYAGDSDAVILAVLIWLRTHQPELFAAPELMAEGFKFEVDLINHESYDLGITLKLSERVSAKNVDGQTLLQHHAEPPLDPYEGVESWEFFVKGESQGVWGPTTPVS